MARLGQILSSSEDSVLANIDIRDVYADILFNQFGATKLQIHDPALPGVGIFPDYDPEYRDLVAFCP